MTASLTGLHAVLSTLLMYLLTAGGAAMVFALRRVQDEGMNALMALGAGIMLAASYFSLLSPALSHAQSLAQSPIWAVGLPFLLGGTLVLAADHQMARHSLRRTSFTDTQRRTLLLIASITLHNIPEGLAVGCAFGALCGASTSELYGAWLLAIGIALQNFPEGAAVSLPLRRDGYSRGRAFLFGQASGAVEPLSGVLGALMAMHVSTMLPCLLSLSAGAMMAVILLELLPECQKSRYQRLMILAALTGFVLMMLLDTMELG